MARSIIDCRSTANTVGCTLTLIGEPEEVVDAAAQHAVAVHGHTDGPELRAMLHAALAAGEQPHAGR
jgi:hypothetical protein